MRHSWHCPVLVTNLFLTLHFSVRPPSRSALLPGLFSDKMNNDVHFCSDFLMDLLNRLLTHAIKRERRFRKLLPKVYISFLIEDLCIFLLDWMRAHLQVDSAALETFSTVHRIPIQTW